jgi:hypothetical protein
MQNKICLTFSHQIKLKLHFYVTQSFQTNALHNLLIFFSSHYSTINRKKSTKYLSFLSILDIIQSL